VSIAGCSDEEIEAFRQRYASDETMTQRDYDNYMNDCTDRRNRDMDMAAGLNVRIPADKFFDVSGDSIKKPFYADYTLTVDTARSSMHSLDGVSLLWTSFAVVNDATNCTLSDARLSQSTCAKDVQWIPPVAAMSGGVFSVPGRTAKTLAMDDLPLTQDIALSPIVTGSQLVRTTRPGSRDAVMAVRVGKGCGTMQIVLRMQWLQTTEMRRGVSLSGNTVACWKRTMTVVAFQAVPYTCEQPYYLNQLREKLKTQTRADVRNELLRTMWGSRQDGFNTLNYPPAQADLMLECAQPSNGLGGKWVRFSSTSPGLCVACAEWDMATLQRDHKRVRACNRTIEVGDDCCSECRSGYVQNQGICVPWCRPGTYYSGSGCWPCSAGTYSLGGSTACQTCEQLGFWNAYVDKVRGCVVCDAKSHVQGSACVPCKAGERVAPRSSTCTGCGLSAYYLPAASTVCTACPAGTFMMNAGATACQACAPNYVSLAASTDCTVCPNGKRHSANHTTCIPCPAINASLLPYTVYAQAGCTASCRAGVAYQRTSPLVAGGCASCSTLAVPTGRYLSATYTPDPRQWITCPETLPCTNAPVHATYTGPSPTVGASLCPYACTVGYTGTNCVACAPVGFNASVHQMMAGGCNYTCKPYVYVDAGRLCRSPCVNLLGELIGARVREYPLARARPFYVFGACGTTQTSPASPLPALRRSLWAYIDTRGGSLCGDAILNTGETCDDGNRVSGDGCSSACQVEAGLWDCDLIGTPCLPQCGWPSVATRSGDIGLATWGFILPSATSCEGLRYVDVRDSVTDRLGWMRANLVSCDCDGRPYRAVPYANCSVANRGCRICGTNYYHDDVRSVCVACGTSCAAGFARATSFAKCGLAIAFNNASLVDQQLVIGCGACPALPGLVAGAVTYVASPCLYACRRGGGSPQDTYCADAPDIATGICSSFCRPCSSGFSALLNTQPPSAAGWYPQGCIDGIGYVWAQCDAAGLPANAVWTGNTQVANAVRGCPYACASTALSWNDVCYPCSASTTSCSPGQHLAVCANGIAQACVPCEGALPGQLQAWTSVSPFTDCTPDCEPGVGYAADMGGQCQPCTRVACALGTLYHACVPRADAYCEPCPPRPDYTEFVAAGGCATRCASGYYLGAGDVCRACTVACATGYMPSKTCDSVEDRFSPPTCVACVGQLATGAVWGGRCAPTCGRWLLAVARNGTASCELCDPIQCGLGFDGVCESVTLFVDASSQLYSTTRLTCTPCDALPAGTAFAMPGLCTALVCLPQFVPETDGSCVPAPPPPTPPPTPAPPTLVLAGGSSLRPELQYPVRGRRHS
jgi:cysteine-rich repeat protein